MKTISAEAVKLTVPQIITHLKDDLGVKFNLVSEEAASDFLKKHNYYFRLKQYMADFEDRTKSGKYLSLDFGHLVELSTIDMYLRKFILKMTIDLEHYLKVVLVNSCQSNPEDDGYAVVEKFFEKYPRIKIEEKEKIGNPESLGNIMKEVVWEQFLNQIAVTAGEDFIRENNGLTLDLRNEAHIQTAENFAKGKIATHNHISKVQLEQNYDRYKNTPHKEFRKEYVNPGMDKTLKRIGELKNQGIDKVPDIYTGRQIPTEKKLENGKENPKAAQREHVKSSAELYSNPAFQMANTDEELAAIINSPENLQGYTTAERNNRKSDKNADEMTI